MGTSKSYGGIKGNPNWTHLKSSVSRACDTGSIPKYKLSNVASNFAKLLGGSNYGGRGQSKIGGRAGIKTAQKLGGFLSSVKSSDLRSALAGVGFDTSDIGQIKVKEVINFLLEYCAGVAASLDEVASKAAEKQLLEEIESNAKTFEDLERNFKEKIQDYGIEELLIRFFAYYIYEHLSIDFYEKLIEDKGKVATANFFNQLKDFLFEKLKNISQRRDLSRIDWISDDGNTLVENIFEDTLKEFENYES